MRKGSKRGPFISFLLERRRKNELNLFGAKEQEEEEDEDGKKKVCFVPRQCVSSQLRRRQPHIMLQRRRADCPTSALSKLILV